MFGLFSSWTPAVAQKDHPMSSALPFELRFAVFVQTQTDLRSLRRSRHRKIVSKYYKFASDFFDLQQSITICRIDYRWHLSSFGGLRHGFACDRAFGNPKSQGKLLASKSGFQSQLFGWKSTRLNVGIVTESTWIHWSISIRWLPFFLITNPLLKRRKLF